MDMEQINKRIQDVEQQVLAHSGLINELKNDLNFRGEQISQVDKRLTGIETTLKTTTIETMAEIKSVERELKDDIQRNQSAIIRSNERTTDKVLSLVSETNNGRNDLWKYILGAGGFATLATAIIQAFFGG